LGTAGSLLSYYPEIRRRCLSYMGLLGRCWIKIYSLTIFHKYRRPLSLPVAAYLLSSSTPRRPRPRSSRRFRPFQPRFFRVTGASWRWWAPASTPRVPEAEGEAAGRVQIPLQNLPHSVRQSASALSALPVGRRWPPAPLPSPRLAGQGSPSRSRSLLLLAMCSMN